MAQSKETMAFKLAVVLSLLLMVSMAEGVQISIGFGSEDSGPVCNSVHGAASGDTCSSVAKEFNMSLQDFTKINPNLNCDAIFIGQWLCINGST